MQGAFLPEWIEAGAALAVLFAFSYIQIRHVGLAAAAAFAPLPGYLLAVAWHAPLRPLDYLCGFIVAGVFLSAIETRICNGASRADAARRTMRSIGPAIFWLLAFVAGAMAVFSAADGDIVSLMSALTTLFCGLSALAIVLPAARFLPYNDEFVVRANRLRERRDRWLDRLSFAVQPRWGWSVSGVALIFAVLGFFGGQNFRSAWPFAAAVLAMEGGLFVIIAGVATRNIRSTIAFLLSAAVLACLAFWICRRLPIDGRELALIVAVVPTLIMAIQSAKFVRRGDGVAVANLRASEQFAIPIAFFCLASSIALLALGAFIGAVLIALGGVVALIVFPALTTAIHDLFPPRVSLDAYRIR